MTELREGEHVRVNGRWALLSAEFIGGMLDIEDALKAGAPETPAAEPAKKKHASGPVKARATSVKRMKK